MPSNIKSPYTTSFNSAIKRGTPAGKAVEAIAKRTNKNANVIFNSLHKAGVCQRQKFNGQWVYWPVQNIKTSATNAKVVQTELWQNFVDWCIISGQCKPQQLENQIGSQQAFMTFCKKFFVRQINGTGTTGSTGRKTTRKRRATTARKTTAAGRKRTTSARKRTTTTGARKRTTRRVRRAA